MAVSFEEDPVDEALGLAVKVVVVVVFVEVDVVSLGPVEPEVLLLMTRPLDT